MVTGYSKELKKKVLNPADLIVCPERALCVFFPLVSRPVEACEKVNSCVCARRVGRCSLERRGAQKASMSTFLTFLVKKQATNSQLSPKCHFYCHKSGFLSGELLGCTIVESTDLSCYSEAQISMRVLVDPSPGSAND